MTNLIVAYRIFEYSLEKVESQAYTLQGPIRHTPTW
jgi:hypothetical protein